MTHVARAVPIVTLIVLFTRVLTPVSRVGAVYS
jgi:hypothetical protein